MSDDAQLPTDGPIATELQIVLDALKDAHRRDLQRQALEWAERLRRSDNERLKLLEAQEEQQDAWADESDSLRQQVEAARNGAAAMQAQLARAEERLLAAEREAERAQQVRQQLDVHRASLAAQVEALKTREREQIEQARTTSDAAKEQVARAEERLAAAERDAERARQANRQLDDQLALLVAQVEGLLKTDEREQVELARKAARAAHAQTARVEERLAAVERTVEGERQQFASQRASLIARIDALRAREADLTKQARNAATAAQDAVVRAEERLAAAERAFENERQQVAEQRASLIARIDALRAREAELTKQARSAADAAQAAVVRAEERLQVAARDFERKCEEYQKLEGRLSSLHDQIDGLKARVGELGMARDRLAARLTAAQAAGQRNDTRHRAALAAVERKRAEAQTEAERLQNANLALVRKVERLRESSTFRLGQALVSAGGSWRGLVRLPGELWQLAGPRRLAQGRDVDAAEPPAAPSQNPVDLKAFQDGDGPAVAGAPVRGHLRGGSDSEREATALTQLARRLLADTPDEAQRLARRAFALDPRPFRRKWLGFLLHHSGSIVEAHELLSALPPGEALNPSDRHKLERIAGNYRLKSQGVTVPPRAGFAWATTTGPIAYIAASSLPFHATGYTLRTQALLRSWLRLGHEVLCLTRPGYPDDRADARQPGAAAEHVVDGVRYRRIEGPNRRETGPDHYIEKAAQCIEAVLRGCRASVVHAASNYENALPALIAARRLGLPFVYEVRGLWEYTAASSRPGWEGSEAFALQAQLEALVASNADRVFTLTQGLANELVARGVERTRIALAPNAIDPQAFLPRPPDMDLATRLALPPKAFVVGYAGSVVGYEGLDDLIVALSHLRRSGPDAQALILGDGNSLPTLKALAASLGLSEQVRFTGHVAPAEVARYLSLVQAVVLPRKPFTVCRLVSPLKPLEAMAMGIPVVVSDVAALAEMVEDGATGFVFPAGQPEALAALLARMAADPLGCRRVADAGREHVVQHRHWDIVCAAMMQDYPAHGRVEAASADEGGAPTRELRSAAEPAPVLAVPVASGVNAFSEDEKAAFNNLLQKAYEGGGAPALAAVVGQQTAGHSKRFTAFCEERAAAVCLQHGDLDAFRTFADRALARDQSASTVRTAARLFSQTADLDRANALVLQLRAALGTPSSADERFMNEVQGRRALADAAQAGAAPRRPVTHPRRVLNLLAFSLPYTSVGYATRSHGLALGIRHAGWDILPFTRPGFPQDFKPELQGQTLPERDLVEGIEYGRLFEVQRTAMNEVEYLQSCVEHYARLIERTSPAIVHAASNYVTALPALIAARRLGVPFVYEVRGFWEVTRSSRDEAFEQTTKYRHMQLFEGIVARQADRVLTITSAMKEELVKRGVAPEHIDIAFNSVDPARFVQRPRDATLAGELGIPEGVTVIGYIGSFVDYEGLDDLLSAAAGLKADGRAFHLLLVGDGSAFEALRHQVGELDLADRVTMTGRVPHDRVEDYYSLIDIAPFPRKPWEVCDLVSPIKPFEAMALCKAVVVSGTRALTEIVADGETGLVFPKGDVRGLQLSLAALLDDPERRAELGTRARAWVERERSWDVAGRTVGKCYEAVLADPMLAAA